MIVLIALSQVGDVSIYSAMFGYLPNLLHKVGKKWSDIGFYQGVVLTLYMTTFCLSSLVTGKIIDRCGSRTLFVICLFGQGCVACFAAFTSTIEWLYISAILIGLSEACGIVAKVIVYEISDDQNQSYVYNFAISMPCNVSLFLGPALGGILSFPTEQYPGLFPQNSMLVSFPILLPNVILSLILLVTSIFAFLTFRTSGEESKLTSRKNKHARNRDRQQSVSLIEEPTDEGIGMIEFYSQHNVVVSTFVMIAYSLATDGFQTLLGVWLQTPSSLFGMGYSPRKSGLLMLISGVFLFISDSLIVGKAIDKLGLKRGLIVSFAMYAFFVSIIWMIPKLNNKSLIFTSMTITLVLIRTSVSGVKVALFAYMNNLVPNNIRGRVISVRECINSLAGIAAHPLAGSAFAWSLSNIKNDSSKGLGFPLNYVFTFYLISIISFAATCTSALLDNNPREIRRVDRDVK